MRTPQTPRRYITASLPCPDCEGAGVEIRNTSRWNDPQCDVEVVCLECDGDGTRRQTVDLEWCDDLDRLAQYADREDKPGIVMLAIGYALDGVFSTEVAS